VLPDVVCPRPRILFAGINPSLRSEAVGHHFAGKGNPFWRLLLAARLIDEPLGPDDDARVAEWGYAITNLCPRATRAASELSRVEIAAGAAALREKIAAWKPEIVAFVGLSVYRDVVGKAGSPGAGEKAERMAGARVFVLPNPSGLNASYPGFEDKRVWFAKLKQFADRVSPSRKRRRPPDRTRPSRPARSSRPGSSPGTAGDNPRRSRTAARRRSRS